MSKRGKRHLERIVKSNRRNSFQAICHEFNEGKKQILSKRTIQRKLHESGFKKRSMKKKLIVREVNKKKRLSWCHEKRRWTIEQWKKVIFSDESKVVIGKDQRIQIWRKNGEGWRPDLYGPKKSSSVVYEVMILGCICWSGVGTVTKVEGNIDAQKYIEVLDESLRPVLIRHFPRNDYLFQDDNAPVHRARIVKEYTARNHIKCMSWPPQFPDINIIENI